MTFWRNTLLITSYKESHFTLFDKFLQYVKYCDYFYSQFITYNRFLMGRMLKVGIYALIILLLYFWVTALMKAGKKTTEKSEPIEEVADTSFVSQDNTEFTEEETDFISNEDIVSGKIPYKDVDKTIEALSENKNLPQKTAPLAKQEKNPESTPAKPTQQKTEQSRPAIKQETPQTITVNTGEEGDYLVIAGSFILEDNANAMAKKLRAMGYPNAGVVVFSASEYYSVVAVKHKTQEKAQLSVDALKRKGIDCFVKKKS